MIISEEIDKLFEEADELNLAIKDDNVDYIVEELADVNVVLNNLYDLLIEKYQFSNEEFNGMCAYKKARTERRFREGYYGKQEVTSCNDKSGEIETIL